MIPYVYVSLVLLSYGLFVVVKILINKRLGSVFFALSVLLVFIGALWTASMYLIGTPIIAYTHNLVLLLAFLFMSFILAKRFGLAYRNIEQLHKESQEQKTIIENISATQSRWLNNIAHKLRTPLTLILGPIHQFLKKHSDSHNLSLSDIEMAERNSERLLNLVNEILDVSKIESNQLTLKMSPTNLSELITKSIVFFKESAKEKGVTLTINIPPETFLIIDKHQIQNLLINLIANALKFTQRGGEINVKAIINPKKGAFISVKTKQKFIFCYK